MKPPKRLFKNRPDDSLGVPSGGVVRLIRKIRSSGLPFRKVLENTTAIVAACEQGNHGYGPAPLKAAVIAALNEAFLSEDAWVETLDIKDHPDESISNPGLFLAVFLAFGGRRDDQMFQESALRIVQETMDELIATGAGSEDDV